jgi:hypothetical protein
MRSKPASLLAALILLVAACGNTPVAQGWRGADLHLVDDIWIGTEVDCSTEDGDLPVTSLGYAVSRDRVSVECRTIIDRAKAALEPSVRNSMTRIVLATLPGTYVTADGKELRPRRVVGIRRREAVVIDSVDGSRQVMGLSCYLPGDGEGRLHVSAVTCDIDPLEDWQDGTVPPSYDPGRDIP